MGPSTWARGCCVGVVRKKTFVSNPGAFRGEGINLMRRSIRILLAAVAVLVLSGQAVLAGSPHFVGAVSVTRDGNSLIVSGKEAGLGNEDQIHIVVNATAQCINPGDHHPKAGNKQSVSAAGDFPVQNGKANFSLTLTATFQPDCTPPMTVVFTDVSVTDTTNGITATLSGTF
jgi:hypothetical protein